MPAMATSSSSTFVAVAGSIGTGKTALVNALASTMDAEPLPEDVAKNPYFDLFYEQPKRWAFHSQVAFAADSMARHVRATNQGHVVQDRTIYEVVDVFGRILMELGNLDAEELRILTDLRDGARAIPRQPTVMVYLHAPPGVLLERVRARSRKAERHLTNEYMQRLQRRYDEFIDTWTACPLLVIDTAQRDLRRPDELEMLVEDLRSMQES